MQQHNMRGSDMSSKATSFWYTFDSDKIVEYDVPLRFFSSLGAPKSHLHGIKVNEGSKEKSLLLNAWC